MLVVVSRIKDSHALTIQASLIGPSHLAYAQNTDCKPAFHLVPGPSSRSTRAYGHSKYQSSNRFGVEDLAHTILSVLSTMSRHGILSGNVLAGIANGDMLSLPRQVVPVGHLVVSVASVFLHCALAYCNRSCL